MSGGLLYTQRITGIESQPGSSILPQTSLGDLDVNDTIKSMQLYPRPERIFDDLAASGFGPDDPLPLATVNQFDQLHYHGVEALDAAIATLGIKPGDRVLEVGSGWGGCARYIGASTGAQVTAVELQADYDRVARTLTRRTQTTDHVHHVNADFLTVDLTAGSFDQAVSWLALFHIPSRPAYLTKLHQMLTTGGQFFAEDLYLIAAPDDDEKADFNRHLFPNSLVPKDAYLSTLDDAGFDITQLDDMTDDWAAFTHDRLAVFRDNRDRYIATHGVAGYETIELFYTKMAGYFARGLVGGLRFAADRRD